MKQAFITELAESDLTKIWVYIARDDPSAADRLIDKLRSECQRLAFRSQRGRHREDLAPHLRSYRIGNYYIFYFPTEAGIEVARFLHGARDLRRIF